MWGVYILYDKLMLFNLIAYQFNRVSEKTVFNNFYIQNDQSLGISLNPNR